MQCILHKNYLLGLFVPTKMSAAGERLKGSLCMLPKNYYNFNVYTLLHEDGDERCDKRRMFDLMLISLT